MTPKNKRRTFLQRIGGMSVIGLPTRRGEEASTSDSEERLRATDLVIPASEIPSGFERYPTPDSNSFLDTLNESALDVASTDIAAQGYWKGTTQSNPEWVLSTTAIVADDPLPRAPILTAARHSYNKYVTEYDAETGPLIDFKQSYRRDGQTADWRVEILETSPFDTSTDSADHLYTDRMRHQFLGRVVLGTIAFGPTDTDPPIDSLLVKYATLQRNRYETHEATP